MSNEYNNGNGRIEDVNVERYAPLISPYNLKIQVPLGDEARETIRKGRQSIKCILDRRDNKKIIVVGPCSMHDEKAAKDYAEKLKGLSEEVKDGFVLVMRTYFEKPIKHFKEVINFFIFNLIFEQYPLFS